MIDKLPPQAIDVEEVLLGALLIEGQSIYRIRSLLTPEMFYKQQHQKVYEVILNMASRSEAIDLVTVKENSDIQATALSNLTIRVGSAAHVKEHAAIIYEKWLAREMISLGSKLIEQSYSEDILDVLNNARDRLEKRLLGLLGINSYGISIKEAADRSLDEYFKREQMVKQGIRSGIPSPFDTLDKYTAGWQKEQLIILAARPGMGKTSLAISFLINAAKEGKSVAMYSLEMSAIKLSDKIICSIADIGLGDYKKGRLLDDEKIKAEQSLDTLNGWIVHFNDNLLIDFNQIYASAQGIKTRVGLDLVIIDYLQLMKGVDKNLNREREVAENSRRAKMMAVELGCPVILLSQLNRGLEARGDKRPMLSDLRESGAIEQDADIVLFVYRESVYNSESQGNKGELIMAKHREGPTGTIEFFHNETFTRFSDTKQL